MRSFLVHAALGLCAGHLPVAVFGSMGAVTHAGHCSFCVWLADFHGCGFVAEVDLSKHVQDCHDLFERDWVVLAAGRSAL